MNQPFLLLSLSYVALIIFIVWSIFGKRFRVSHKIIICLLLPLVYFLHWTSMQETKGWPSDQTLPTQFELISADVVEPNPLEKISGNIHLWIRPGDEGPPRAYSLVYSRELHRKLFETKKRIANGRRQIGLLFDDSSGHSGASIGGGMKLGFRNAPRKHLPPKR
ncbi:MAG: hypothetical protein V7749_03540 [Cocleimonas sp.]